MIVVGRAVWQEKHSHKYTHSDVHKVSFMAVNLYLLLLLLLLLLMVLVLL